MGAAAYNRGTKLIRRQLDSELPCSQAILVDDLNAMPKQADAMRPFGPVMFKHDGNKHWWAIDPVKQWRGFGFYFPTLRQAVSSFKVVITEHNGDHLIGVPQ